MTEINEQRMEVLFSKNSTPFSRALLSRVFTWPAELSELTYYGGSFAKVFVYDHSGKRIVEARPHPAVDWLLELIVPALCERDASVFESFAAAIKTVKEAGFPDRRTAYFTLKIACEWSGLAMPFNHQGEPFDGYFEDESLKPLEGLFEDRTKELPDMICLQQTESEFRRKVEQKIENSLNPGAFTKVRQHLNIECAKRDDSGGRGRKRS